MGLDEFIFDLKFVFIKGIYSRKVRLILKVSFYKFYDFDKVWDGKNLFIFYNSFNVVRLFVKDGRCFLFIVIYYKYVVL